MTDIQTKSFAERYLSAQGIVYANIEEQKMAQSMSSIRFWVIILTLFTLFAYFIGYIQTGVVGVLIAVVETFFSPVVLLISLRQEQKGRIRLAAYIIILWFIVALPLYVLAWVNFAQTLVIFTIVLPSALAFYLLPRKEAFRILILTCLVAPIPLLVDPLIPWSRLASDDSAITGGFAIVAPVFLGLGIVWQIYRIYRDSRSLRVRLLFDFITVAVVTTILPVTLLYFVPQETLPVYVLIPVVTVVPILLGFGVGLFESRTLATPMANLAETATRISQGELELQADIPQLEEIAVVARSFNLMTSQLRELINNLEIRVAERTQALSTSAEVSRRLSSILDQQQLVTAVVEQIRSAFDFYHTHIYLFDAEKENLLLAGGTGEAGRQMLANKHKVSKGRGLVGRAAETNAPVLVPDVTQENGWLPNPLLPETKSELAVPIARRGQVLGVLDVQHNITGGLNQATSELLLSIANQIGVALQNANLLSETERQAESLAQLNEMSAQLNLATNLSDIFAVAVRQTTEILHSDRATLALLTPSETELEILSTEGETGLMPVGLQVPVHGSGIGLAIQENRVVYYQEIKESTNQDLQSLAEQGIRSVLIAPLVAGGKTIGTLNVASNEPNAYTSRDEDLMRQTASLLSSAIENARLTQQTKEALELTENLYQAGRRLNEAKDLQELVAVIPYSISIPAINRVTLNIFEYNVAGEVIATTVAANWYRGQGTLPPDVGTRFTRQMFDAFSFFLESTPTYISDILTDNRLGEASTTLAKTLGIRAIAIWPLFVGTRQTGTLVLMGDEPYDLTDREKQPLSALTAQLAISVESRRLYDQAQERAEQERRVRTITDKIRRGTNREDILRIARQEISELLGASQSTVRLGTQAQLLSRMKQQAKQLESGTNGNE